MFTVQSYMRGAYGPYWRVLRPDGKEAAQLVSGVPYPLDGFHDQHGAQRAADKLN